MADEKLNVSPEENPQPSLFDASPEGAPAQDDPTPDPPAPEDRRGKRLALCPPCDIVCGLDRCGGYDAG
ncbi:MAG: hypothetical protein HFF18_13085 [Oscillospiraceae bacterium]|nr:hypothetical protein [Oscillospiraceae bacterium]